MSMALRAMPVLAGLLVLGTGCRAAPDAARQALGARMGTPTAADSAKQGATDSLSTPRIDTLLAQLRSSSPTLRSHAAVALAGAGPRRSERVRALAAALGDTSAPAATTAAWALAQFGSEAIPALLDAVTDQRSAVRARAVYALGEMGPAAVSALPRVHAALRDGSRSVREMASWSVTRIDSARRGGGTPTLGVIADLQAGLASPDPLDRSSAVQRYRALTSGDVRACIPLLVNSLSDPDPGVRAAAADALVRLGPAARASLVAALSDTNAMRRREASITLVRLTRPAL